jgi:hypothetical protein
MPFSVIVSAGSQNLAQRLRVDNSFIDIALDTAIIQCYNAVKFEVAKRATAIDQRENTK